MTPVGLLPRVRLLLVLLAMMVAMGTAPAGHADRVTPCPSRIASDDAITLCTDALQNPVLSDEDRAYAHWLRGWRYCQRRQYTEALSDFDAAIKLIPEDGLAPDAGPYKTEDDKLSYDVSTSYGDFYVGRSCALAGLHRFPDALDAVTKGEQISLSLHFKGYARGEQAGIYELMGNLAKAETVYREAVSMEVNGGDNGMDERYRLMLVLVGLNKTDTIKDVLGPKDISGILVDRKPALLLYVLGLLPSDQTQNVLAKEDLSFGGEDDALAGYFAGRIDLDKLMAKPADYNEAEHQDRLCVINFFLGEWALSNNRPEAISRLQAAVATGAQQLPEYMAAKAVLRRLTAQ